MKQHTLVGKKGRTKNIWPQIYSLSFKMVNFYELMSLKSEEKLITQVTLIKDNAPVLVEKKQQGAQQTKHTKKYFRVSI